MESSTSAASRWKQIFSNAGWKSYLSQDIVLAAFSMTLLYLTVLSLGLLMTAFLNWKGMSEAELSIYRGLGAVSGVAATFAFPTLQTRVGEHSPRLCRLVINVENVLTTSYDGGLLAIITITNNIHFADVFQLPAAAKFVQQALSEAALSVLVEC